MPRSMGEGRVRQGASVGNGDTVRVQRWGPSHLEVVAAVAVRVLGEKQDGSGARSASLWKNLSTIRLVKL